MIRLLPVMLYNQTFVQREVRFNAMTNLLCNSTSNAVSFIDLLGHSSDEISRPFANVFQFGSKDNASTAHSFIAMWAQEQQKWTILPFSRTIHCTTIVSLLL